MTVVTVLEGACLLLLVVLSSSGNGDLKRDKARQGRGSLSAIGIEHE